MNQQCKVCGEPAAGFHFGAFTCEGCKSFFGRTYNNLSSISDCKNNGECIINKKNRTACKACRLRKCLVVGMSKSGSRYGRRSNWFKIHCLLQEQQQQNNLQQTQSKLNTSPSIISPNLLPAAALVDYYNNRNDKKTFTDDGRKSSSPSDSGASSADPEEDNSSRSTSALSFFKPSLSPCSDKDVPRKRKTSNISLTSIGGSSSSTFLHRNIPNFAQSTIPSFRTIPSALMSDSRWTNRSHSDLLFYTPTADVTMHQEQPIDLSLKSSSLICGRPSDNVDSDSEPELSIDMKDDDDGNNDSMKNPLDLSLVSKRAEEVPMTG